MRMRALFAFSLSLAAIGSAAGDAPAEAQGRTRSLSQSSVAAAARQHPQIVAEFGGEEGGARGDYIREVGARVAGRTNIAGGGSAFRVTTLNSPVMNAFAVPGGYLYVTRQLVALANDEAELAFVLGHEAGHIAARHSSERKRATIFSQILAIGLGAVTGSSQLGNFAGQVTQGLVLSYSRRQEYEADDLGVGYLAAAGYDPEASARCLARSAPPPRSRLGPPDATTSAPSRAGRARIRSAPTGSGARLRRRGRRAGPAPASGTATSSSPGSTE